MIATPDLLLQPRFMGEMEPFLQISGNAALSTLFSYVQMVVTCLGFKGSQNHPSGKGTQKTGRQSTASIGEKRTHAPSVERAFAGKSELPMNNQL